MGDATAALESLELNEERFVGLLRNLIGEVEKLQNTGVGTAYVPQEDLAIKHVLDVLAPHRVENGGPLEIDHVTYAEGRGNLIIKYPGTGTAEDVLSFVGSHLDVVPANPDAWDVDPFSLTVDGDKLSGRGTTDCLGHVALMTTLFSQIAELKPKLKTSLTCVFIASEEASGPGIGVDGLVAEGKLDHCKPGPVVWVDCADSQPCIGTAGAITWHLTATGHRFHSGLPHKGINGIELGMEACARLQAKFYETFPACQKERDYKFITPSTMKPTQIKCAPGGLNQIPPEATISGDVRLTPFYEVAKLKQCIEDEVAAMNKDVEALPTRGPCSKYVINPEGAEPIVGRLSLEWGDHLLTGIACDLESPAFKLMCDAINEVKGKAEPYSLTGSLPLVHEMQQEGFDIQLIGFGLMSTYHADNEYCSLNDMKDAAKILSRLITKFG
jgi:acetylornithine deacetylase